MADKEMKPVGKEPPDSFGGIVEDIQETSRDIDEIQEDVEGIQEDVEEIKKAQKS